MPQPMFEHLLYWAITALGWGMITICVLVIGLVVLTLSEMLTRR